MKSQDSLPYGDLLQVLQKSFFPSRSVERQVASHVRDLIQAKKIPEGVRLPPIRTLAEAWGTNYSTVRQAFNQLVGEGLLIQRPHKGTFVATQRRALRRACLYSNKRITTDWSHSFYAYLNVMLYSLLAEREMVIVPYFDSRPHRLLRTIPADIREMAQDGEIDAIIVTQIFPHQSAWIYKLEVPVATAIGARPQAMVKIDFDQLAQFVVELAITNRRRTIGFIGFPSGSTSSEMDPVYFLKKLESLAEEKGIAVIRPKKITLTKKDFFQDKGAELCESLLDAVQPPDMIFVFPDIFIRNVLGALQRRGKRVPEDILLVSHRNEEMPILTTPVPVIWLTVKIEDFARGLLTQIERQIGGRKLSPAIIPVHGPSD